MYSQFLTREAAKDKAQWKLPAAWSAYQPQGPFWDRPEHPFLHMHKPAKIWTYRTPGVEHGPMRLMFCYSSGERNFGVLVEHNGRWYKGFLEPPYLLYQRYEWTDAEIVFVCERESVADLVESIGLDVDLLVSRLSELVEETGVAAVIMTQTNQPWAGTRCAKCVRSATSATSARSANSAKV